MAFRINLDVSGVECDKCRKPMNEDAPGVVIQANTREGGRQIIWVHVRCLHWIGRNKLRTLGYFFEARISKMASNPSKCDNPECPIGCPEEHARIFTR